MRGLIVGAGNAGLNYLKSAIALNHSVDLCESNMKDKGYINDLCPDVLVLRSIEEVEKNYDYIIIATGASSHLSLSMELIKLSPKTLVVEKLISNNLRDLDEFSLLQAANPHVLFTSHNRWSLLAVDQEVDNLRIKHSLGTFVSFQSIGGAMCLATGSIHWLASFYDFFELNAGYDLYGSIKAHAQSTRPDLDVINGSFEVRYKSKSLNFHYFNDSKIAPYQTFLFEYGAILMNFDGNYQIIVSKNLNSASLKRYEVGTIIEQGNLMRVGDNPFTNLLNQISSNKVSQSSFFQTIKANELILLSMQLFERNHISYSELGSIKSDPTVYNFDWRIS